MVGIGQRLSTLSQNSGGGGGSNSRPSSKDGSQKNLWSEMLDSVASAKRLPEKNMIVLGMICDGLAQCGFAMPAPVSDLADV